MNKQQIKEELRRSACEDKNPWEDVAFSAYIEVDEQAKKDNRNILEYMHENENCRFFFLLVAEAI